MFLFSSAVFFVPKGGVGLVTRDMLALMLASPAFVPAVTVNVYQVLG